MTTGSGRRPRILCAGDLFITGQALADAARRELGDDIETVTYQADWPDTPFGPVGTVGEAAGDEHELASLAATATAVLTHLAPLTARVFDNAPGLRAVAVTRGGPVNVDLEAATAHGVPVLYLPGRNLNAVAEFVIGAMIALPRNIVAATQGLRAHGDWDARYYRHDLTGPELRACTIGLVGLGAVGTRVAELLRPFGARVVVHDPFASEDAARAVGARLVPFAELLHDSDIVSVHARLTDATRRMFDAAAFAAMKPGARFVNTARGELVDHAALRAALHDGHLAGAALDVFDPEPPHPDDPLLSLPTVIATPHIAGASRQVAADSVTRISATLARFLRTGQARHCANPEWVRHAKAS
jgi:D-3-phosphoglycerate dehydrogenase / 2-oxoglutarate reductase